jgi:hypothetical protein
MHGVTVLVLVLSVISLGRTDKVTEDDFDEFEFEFDLPEDEKEAENGAKDSKKIATPSNEQTSQKDFQEEYEVKNNSSMSIEYN